MQQTSALYKEILSTGIYTSEVSLCIDGSAPDDGYRENYLVSVNTSGGMFSQSGPEVGCCVAREIDIVMLKPPVRIPKNAKLQPWIRITDGKRTSEWIPKGTFYIDTRADEHVSAESDGLRIHGFDDILKAERDYPESNIDWPARDIDVVREIARTMGVEIDPETVRIINKGYTLQYPSGYSMREVLSGIAAMYGGSFIMSDSGKLRLVAMTDIPAETYYLVNSKFDTITFGGVRILVK